MSRSRVAAIALTGSISLSGCATIFTHARYGDLASQTEMQEPVFLEPRNDLPTTVYVEETCSACSAAIVVTVRPKLDRALAAEGYTLVQDPAEATYVLQIHHLRLTETELAGATLAETIQGANQVATAAAIAAEVAGAADRYRVVGAAMLGAGFAGFVVDSKTKHLAHLLTTHLRVTETVAVRDGQGYGEETTERVHETQIVSGASKVNLRQGESLPVLVAGMTHAITGVMPRRTPEGGR